MALWKIRRSNKKIAVIYVNLHTGAMHECGETDPSTLEQVFDWIWCQCQPGDIVSMNDVAVSVIQQPATA